MITKVSHLINFTKIGIKGGNLPKNEISEWKRQIKRAHENLIKRFQHSQKSLSDQCGQKMRI